MFVGTALIAFFMSDESDSSIPVVAGGGSVILAIAMIVGFGFCEVNLDKRTARYYTSATTFYVKDLAHLPQSVHLLGKDGGGGAVTPTKTDSCAQLYTGKENDAYGCVQQGDLSAEGWDPRIGSHVGAVGALKATSGDRQGVSLNEATVTYLNGKNGVWSGILDGSNIQNPLGGVAEWSGRGTAKECKFEGDYAIDRAFAGGKSNSLTNLYNERFPMLRYNMTDVWGFCQPHDKGQPEEPIVVIPVTMPVPYSDRTVDAAAGIVTVRGDHGKTVLEYKPDVKAGEYPGPVYPESLVVKQREAVDWAAGRQNHDRNHFGYEPTSAEVQVGNVSEYLLMEHSTGRLQYVTPLVLRGSGSQLFVAYSVSYADEVHRGQLNQLSVYVLNDDDNVRRVPLNVLLSNTNQWLNDHAPFVKMNGGKLQEFTPINGDTWRAYIENESQVQYLLDVSNKESNEGRLSPKLVSLSASGQTTPAPAGSSQNPGTPQTGNAGCSQNQSLDQWSLDQLQQCNASITGELVKRAQTAQTTSPPK